MLRLHYFETLLLEWREEVGNVVMFVSYFLFWFQI